VDVVSDVRPIAPTTSCGILLPATTLFSCSGWTIAKSDRSRAKRFALNAAAERTKYSSIRFRPVFLDADISLPRITTAVMDRFDENPRLGLAGGAIVEETRGRWETCVRPIR